MATSSGQDEQRSEEIDWIRSGLNDSSGPGCVGCLSVLMAAALLLLVLALLIVWG
jgi:hypothetical protein